MDADLFDRLWNFTLLLGLFNFLLFTYSGLPSRVLDLMALSGAPEALTIICSALLTSAAIGAGRAWLGAAK